jgi:hypothetical protein
MIYFSYFHSIMSYGPIFWGNSYYGNIIFRVQKRAIRIIMGVWDRESCRKLKILSLKSQYIYSLSPFVINNSHHFEVNSEVHSIKTRTKSDFHYPSSNVSVFQKGTYYTGIKVFNSLPASIKDLPHNIEQFKRHIKNFLCSHSFYTLDEYFKYKIN